MNKLFLSVLCHSMGNVRLTKLLRKSIIPLALLAGMILCPVVKADHVKLELSLLADVSGSIDPTEYSLQMQGYKNAFLSAGVQNAILSGGGKIAVNFVQWSGATQQTQTIGWTILDSVASITAFANTVGAQARQYSGLTNPDAAINFSYPLIFSNAHTSDRQVIDVSGDGTGNAAATLAARNAALGAGVDAINGLVIGSNGADALFNFYNTNIKGGANGFVEVAATFADFEDAVTRKLIQEIVDVPVPSGVWLAAIGIVTVAAYRRFGKRAVMA